MKRIQWRPDLLAREVKKQLERGRDLADIAINLEQPYSVIYKASKAPLTTRSK